MLEPNLYIEENLHMKGGGFLICPPPPLWCVSLMVEPNATVVMVQVRVLYALNRYSCLPPLGGGGEFP